MFTTEEIKQYMSSKGFYILSENEKEIKFYNPKQGTTTFKKSV